MHSWTREYLTQMEWLDFDDGIEDLLAIADATAISLASTNDGITQGKFKLLLNSHPDLPVLITINDSDKASGSSDSIEEEIQTVSGKVSEFTLDMDANAYVCSYFFSALLQNGYNEDIIYDDIALGVVKNYEDYQINRYLSFIGAQMKLGGTKDQCVLVRAALPNSIKLSSKEGQVLRIETNIKAGYWTNLFNLGSISSYPANAIPLKIPTLKWQNAKVWIDDVYNTANNTSSGLKIQNIVDSTNKLVLKEFDFTVINNLIGRFYNSDVLQDFILGKVRADGNFIVPWIHGTATVDAEAKYYWKQIDDFRNGIVKRLRIQWGQTWGSDSTASDNCLVIEAYLKYNGSPKVESEEDLDVPMAFTCVRPDSTTPAFKVKFGYSFAGNTVVRRGVDILQTESDLNITTEIDEYLLRN